MPSRVLLSLAIVIVALSAERFGFYGHFMYMAIAARGMFDISTANIGLMYAAGSLASTAGALVAGGAAFVVAPRIIATAGALMATLGLSMFAFASSEPTFWAAICVSGLGSGLVFVSALAYAARALTFEGETDAVAPSGRRFLTLGCFVACAGVAMNVAAATASLMGLVRDNFGDRGGTLIAAAATLSSAALFAISLLVDRDQVAPSDAPPANLAYRTGPSTGTATAPPVNPAVNGVALVLSVPLMIMSIVHAASYEFTTGENFSDRSFAQSAQAGMSMLSGAVIAVVLGVLASKRSALSVFRFIGAGFIVYVAGALLLLARVAPAGAMGVLGLAGPLTGLCIVFPALAQRGRRGTTMLIACFLACEALGNMMNGFAMRWATASTAGGAAMLLAAGVAAILLEKQMQAKFNE